MPESKLRASARQCEGECRAVAAALRRESALRHKRRRIIRIVNAGIAILAVIVLLLWLAAQEAHTAKLLGSGLQLALEVAGTILGLAAAGQLLGGTIYFTFVDPESPDRSGDWSDYLLMYADRIGQLLRVKGADADSRLDENLRLASLNLNDAEGRWPSAERARRRCVEEQERRVTDP